MVPDCRRLAFWLMSRHTACSNRIDEAAMGAPRTLLLAIQVTFACTTAFAESRNEVCTNVIRPDGQEGYICDYPNVLRQIEQKKAEQPAPPNPPTARSPQLPTPPPPVPPLPPAPPQNVSLPDLNSAPARQVVRDQFYTSIIRYVRSRDIQWGRLAGRPFAQEYDRAHRPKAVAVCLDWTNSTPARLNILGQGNFQFVTGANPTCRPKTIDQVTRCVIQECRRWAKCGTNTSCTVVDVNGANALVLPPDWIKRFGG